MRGQRRLKLDPACTATQATKALMCPSNAVDCIFVLQRLSASELSDLKDLEVAVHTPSLGPAVPKPAEAATPDLMAATSECSSCSCLISLNRMPGSVA